MLNDIYSRRVLELAANIPCLGRLEAPDASATAYSKLCGSMVTVDIKLDGNIVTAFAHDVKACALGQATSAIMGHHAVGSSAEELRQIRDLAIQVLKENGAPPSGKWQELSLLEPLREYKARHASILLTFDAVVDALDQIEARRARPTAI
jgi:NifU-like protein involved in Fe-S cluster formation